jgi:hypothetical protein
MDVMRVAESAASVTCEMASYEAAYGELRAAADLGPPGAAAL